MKKIICFLLALFVVLLELLGIVLSLGDPSFDMESEIITQIIAVPIMIGIFTAAQHTIDNAPEKPHRIAAYFRVTSGVSGITYGLPAVVYIMYTWIRSKDGYVMRGREYDGTVGTIIIVSSVLNILRLFFQGLNIITAVSCLVPLFLPFYAAWKVENNRVLDYHRKRVQNAHIKLTDD